jgi:hypothetical protein
MLLHLRAEVHPSTSWLPAVLILYEVRLHFPRRRPRAPQALLAMTSSVPISMNLCGRLVLAPLASLARNRSCAHGKHLGIDEKMQPITLTPAGRY